MAGSMEDLSNILAINPLLSDVCNKRSTAYAHDPKAKNVAWIIFKSYNSIAIDS